MKAVNFSPQNFRLSVGIFRNFRDYFRTIQAEFRDCFRTVQAKFSGLFTESLDRIFGTIFGQSWTVLRFGFDPGTDVLGLSGMFWYPNNSMMNLEGTKRCLVLCGSEIWAILCVVVGKMNNMFFVCKFC